ncbi:glycosyltransferase family 4 protein [Synechococcus sp. Cruz-9H2]|uniref:glycosyltransferase family 4 protein n=1 Tax=unclassified Synechococcus TaxID=2626047 RepID=UPI0020CFAEBD|nr:MULTISPECIES: glycosyltransferase family 1 protein [unclassified Synechococcus]MCP9820985.1 glycosyltransferase family 4 protein [Synechococcus sp. Cruz-9H2]MCP9845227.1 glycosyltransferase family 4 protein [Synechococcus sp. Edmonson 11F2]MCP9857398.1 glycosyltransferase family 4 protein [Synechococcus sp. Cruz-9C9]MCP9864643.1 glycosyltransferase family 4 protein [Synechococcus sp. Cruz-7E5]MCP9871906.1 glycosyltransferase family 4 protein [Synechococcus sp. Cruz-7B9]
MRIGIDVSHWNDTRGFGRFTRELVRAFMSVYGRDHQVLLVCDARTANRGEFPEGVDLRVARSSARPSSTACRSPLELVALWREAARCRADVFFFPSASAFYPVPCPTPVVVTIHDAMTEEHPEWFFPDARSRVFWRIKMWMVKHRSRIIVTPSQDACRRVAEAFGRPLDDVVCIGEAPADCFGAVREARVETAVRERRGIPILARLILYVGGLDHHKNLPMLLRALARISVDPRTPWQLVLVGEHRSRAAQVAKRKLGQFAAELEITERITWTGWVPDEELAVLYRTSALLVLPSHDEGFGLPVVEAMACGLPTAVSSRGSLPEVAGDAGLSFDPEDPQDIADVVTRLLTDDDLRNELSRRGVARAGSLSWASTARRLMATLEAAVTPP